MKTIKSILVVLFMLAAVQIASAYYCPATGRWLSRDPISEPGFQVLQVAQLPDPIQQQAARWIDRDPATMQQTANPYAFLGNKPIRQTDLLGMVGSVPVSLTEAMASGDVAQVEAILAGMSEDDAGYALARAWLKKVAECDAIHAAYDALKCKSCNACTSRAEVLKNAACLTAEAAGRKKYLDLKCDYCLAGSIARGSATAEKGHQMQYAQVLAQLAKCAIKFSSLPETPPPSPAQ